MLPAGGDAAQLALAAIGEDHQRVVPEQVRDGVLVIAEIVVVGVLHVLVRRFQLDEEERKTVDEPQEVRTPSVHLAGDRHLRDQQEVVVGRVRPVDHLDRFDRLAVLIAAGGHPHAILEQVVDLMVGLHRAQRAPVACQFLDGRVDGLPRQARIQSPQRRPQPPHQHDIAALVPAQRAVRAERLIPAVDRLPAKARQQVNCRLFNEYFFGEGTHEIFQANVAVSKSSENVTNY